MNEAATGLSLAKALWKWEPHPTQRTWLGTNAKVKVAACGRRWGKTEAAAIDACATALLRPGSVQMIVSPTYDQSRLIFDTVERLILGSPITRSLAKVVRTPYPRLALGGSLIMARTADEDGRNLRGHSADRVIVDEAAYVRDSVVQEVISPMLADRDGELVMISTPFGKNHFYRAFLRGGRNSPSPPAGEGRGEGDKHCVSFCFPSWENPHISRDYIERQRAELSPRQFAAEYEAQFLDDQASVFPWDDISAAIERHSAVCALHSAPVCVGIDWARYSDYTAVIAVAVDESGLRVVAIDRFNGMGWNRQVERVTGFLREHCVASALTDQTSVGDPLLEQLRTSTWQCGIETVIEGRTFTNASKREIIEHLAMLFARGGLAIPNDEQLIRELQYFEYELTQAGNVRMNARSGQHDDLVVALALACWQARSKGPIGALLSSGGRSRADAW